MIELTPRTLVVSDLDGTLLRSDGMLAPRTVETVNAFIAAGGWFIYATARSFTSASRATRKLDLALPVVTYGGAMIVDPRSGRADAPVVLAGDVVLELLAATDRDRDVEPVVFAVHDGRDRVCWRRDQVTPGIERFLARRAGDPRLRAVADWSSVDLTAVFAVSLIGERDALLTVRELLPRHGVHVVFSEDIYTPDEWWLEVTAADATKADAVATLRRELGADQLVCFGDNQNDLPMFAIADWSVAVRNAVDEVRRAAHEMVGTNDTDAVGSWLMARSASWPCHRPPAS